MERMSAVLIVPATARAAANALASTMGWGPDNYAIALSADDGASVTHYACRADVSAEFVGWLEALTAGTLPPGIPPEALPVVAALTANFAPFEDRQWHMDAVLSARGMGRV